MQNARACSHLLTGGSRLLMDELESTTSSVELTESEALEDREDTRVRQEDEVAVQHWSVEDVISWAQRSVCLSDKCMKEVLNAFCEEEIDGLRLLTLQRKSRACIQMNDSEWMVFNVARESLMAMAASTTSPHSNLRQLSEDAAICPQKPQNSSTLIMKHTPRPGILSASFKLLSSPISWWSSSLNKQDQYEAEFHALQEEICSAEERETALRAKIEHMEEILRAAQLANYFYSRLVSLMRWTPLPGEPLADDVDVDDWLQRFLVLEGSTIFFYPQAADLSPQGAILLSEIIDIGQIPGYVRAQHDEKWFGFQITTHDGLRLECATTLKLQMELWVSTIQSGCKDGSQCVDLNDDKQACIGYV